MGLEGDDGWALCTINELGGFMWAWVMGLWVLWVRGGYGLCGLVGFYGAFGIPWGNLPCGFPLLAVMCGVRVGEGHLSFMTFSLPLYFTVMPLASGLNFCALFFEQYTMVKVRFVSMPGKEP